jgi:tRNA1Val (adenine37-N6)-methyltransferase
LQNRIKLVARSSWLEAVSRALRVLNMSNDFFQFKQFTIRQDRSALKVGTDGVLLGAWTDYGGAKRILDIGTGTGLLALIAAQRNGEAMIDAVEIDDASAEQAAENIAASPWADRIRVHRMDARRMHASEPYDLIICNPPFYPGEMSSGDERVGVAKHAAGLAFPELIELVDRLLARNGRVNVILPKNRVLEFKEEADHLGLNPSRECDVRYLASKPPKRMLIELRRGEQATTLEEITIEQSGPFDYSTKYRELLSDLMLKF